MSRIVIDARLIDSSTGIYMQRLLHFINAAGEIDEYHVLMPSKSVAKWKDKWPNLIFHEANQPIYSFSEQISLLWMLNKLRPTLTHFTMPQQPLLWYGKSVTTVHDLTLVHYDNVDMNPTIYKIRKKIFRFLLDTVLKRSQTIFVPTEFVKRDLLSYNEKLHPGTIVVTPEAGDPIDAEPEKIELLEGKDYLCFVGNAFPYKNIRRTIEAFAVLKLSHPHLHLALAGKKDYFYDELEKYVADNNIEDVHFLGFITDGEKRWLYQNAVAMVTASLSEGFCIPLLEAMYEGCPVVSSNASCLPEVAGDAALYFDPYSTEDLANKLRHLLNTPAMTDLLRKKGYDRVKDFSWQRMADQTIAVYKEVL
jgi:glycosyltransferase involved in cell wall biosynthesis